MNLPNSAGETPDRVTPKLRVAVFLSGGGRTLANLIRHQRDHQLPVEFTCVTSSRSDAGGIGIARDAGIDTRVIRKGDFPDDAVYAREMFDPLRRNAADVVVMAGFLKHVLIPEDFSRRVVNIHPSLLPAFGGQGMFGRHVHAAALRRGVTISGCTVHFVDNHYDNGPIILQKTCPVLPDDSPETLAARVFDVECVALPEAICRIAADPDRLSDSRRRDGA